MLRRLGYSGQVAQIATCAGNSSQLAIPCVQPQASAQPVCTSWPGPQQLHGVPRVCMCCAIFVVHGAHDQRVRSMRIMRIVRILPSVRGLGGHSAGCSWSAHWHAAAGKAAINICRLPHVNCYAVQHVHPRGMYAREAPALFVQQRHGGEPSAQGPHALLHSTHTVQVQLDAVTDPINQIS